MEPTFRRAATGYSAVAASRPVTISQPTTRRFCHRPWRPNKDEGPANLGGNPMMNTNLNAEPDAERL
jgi:hypothetical protein